MRRVDISSRRVLDLEAYRNRTPVEVDYGELIDEPTCVYEGGELRIVYLHLDEPLLYLRRAAAKGTFGYRARTSGLKTYSATFGFVPRHHLFHDYCGPSRWALDRPKSHAVVAQHARLVERVYRTHNPERFAEHEKLAGKLLPAWRMAGTVFTSGIVNDSVPLTYHFDTGNFKNVWSGMIVLKSGVAGGHLSIPEYNLGIACRDRSLLLFDGQGLLHGVTPITRTRANGKRYSIVYYSMQQMWNCEDPSVELARVRKRRDAMESKRSKAEIGQRPAAATKAQLRAALAKKE